jgi:hypothetical protein
MCNFREIDYFDALTRHHVKIQPCKPITPGEGESGNGTIKKCTFAFLHDTPARKKKIIFKTMLLTITTTHNPASDLSFLLHKHPDRTQQVETSGGVAHIFYPEVSDERCTAALLLDIDPVGLVRRDGGPAGNDFALQQYVNDRPYVASSFMSAAIAKAFSSALNGNCKTRPELLSVQMPFEVRLPVLPIRGGLPLL